MENRLHGRAFKAHDGKRKGSISFYQGFHGMTINWTFSVNNVSHHQTISQIRDLQSTIIRIADANEKLTTTLNCPKNLAIQESSHTTCSKIHRIKTGCLVFLGLPQAGQVQDLVLNKTWNLMVAWQIFEMSNISLHQPTHKEQDQLAPIAQQRPCKEKAAKHIKSHLTSSVNTDLSTSPIHVRLHYLR